MMQSMLKQFDVICVGCGPAGNLVSYLLAKRGLRVLLVDKARLPRFKVCGGGLTSKALNQLPYDISSIVHNRMRGAYVYFAGHSSMHVSSEGIGAMVERSQFDAFMTERAVEAGVQVMQETAIQGIREEADAIVVESSRGTFSAQLLIGADGAKSRVRSLLFPGWQPEPAFGIEANYHWPTSARISEAALTNAVFDFGAVRNGYGWIFPKSDHFNVGIYRVQKTREESSLKKALSEFEVRWPILKDCTATTSIGHPIPISDGKQPVEKGRAILIGDAAGLGEAFFGEGIAFALKSAEISAEWSGAALEKGGFQPRQTFRSALRPLIVELRYSLWMAKAMYVFPPTLMSRLASFSIIRTMMIHLLEGKTSYRRSFWKLLVLIPFALLQPQRARPLDSPFRTE